MYNPDVNGIYFSYLLQQSIWPYRLHLVTGTWEGLSVQEIFNFEGESNFQACAVVWRSLWKLLFNQQLIGGEGR